MITNTRTPVGKTTTKRSFLQLLFDYLHPCTTTISSKRQLVLTILLVRFVYWFLMTLSCHLIPDHNPGDDVLRFDMRLDDVNDDCFCLQGHVCDDDYNNIMNEGSATPHDATTTTTTALYQFSRAFWKFWLSPLTKWDAARFLNLAVQPTMRNPSGTAFSVSEEAHAFFPMFPALIGQVACYMLRLIRQCAPSLASSSSSKIPFLWFLPPTFEGVVVLVGFCWNNIICVVLSTVALYHLTMTILTTAQTTTTIGREKTEKIAIATCLVYGIWNPALVFFTTTYSESFFGTCSLLGHWTFITMAQRGSLFTALVSSIPIWMVATYTRSNGTIHSLWLLQYGLALLVSCCFGSQRNSKTMQQVLMGMLYFLLCFVGAIFVAVPFRYHDWQGYRRHCDVSSEVMTTQPTWCLDNSQQQEETPASFLATSFSLYGWTQRAHWNVGPFHYYELKQIPNFLLAAPILGLSILGVVTWIRYSLVVDYGKGKLPKSIVSCIWYWPIQALNDSVSTKSAGTVGKGDDCDDQYYSLLVHNPILLGHYAILAFLTLVGIVVAHVQISTRMICSSSPAIIWFLTYCHFHCNENENQDTNGNRRIPLKWCRYLLNGYTLLYLLLGVILHVNFLPWT